MQALKFGTRGSELAQWQTNHVIDLLRAVQSDLQIDLEIIKTRGDQILDTPLPLLGGKGVFTAELENALFSRRIDGAVHSLKDLPTEQTPGLVIGAITERANPADVLVSRHGYKLATLPPNAVLGTSSYRRAAQLLNLRPDLKIVDIRGNIGTRIRKALDPENGYDAIVLAYAGLERLGHEAVISEILPAEIMLPAPGQGAIGVQTRDDPAMLTILHQVHHLPTALAVTAERAFLSGLGGGCSLPVAAFAQWIDSQLHVRGRVSAQDGSQRIDVQLTRPIEDAAAAATIGRELAQQALDLGARQLMEQQP